MLKRIQLQFSLLNFNLHKMMRLVAVIVLILIADLSFLKADKHSWGERSEYSKFDQNIVSFCKIERLFRQPSHVRENVDR